MWHPVRRGADDDGNVVERLSKSFRGARAGDTVSFTAAPGAVTGLLGPNGSGKTTVLRLMTGLVRGTGVARFNGVRFAEYPYGSFTVQQRAPGASIQYGLYPNPKYAGTRYWLVVKISGKKKPYDVKNQSYPPHGSVDIRTARQFKGKTLTLQGTIHRGGKLTLSYQLDCVIA